MKAFLYSKEPSGKHPGTKVYGAYRHNFPGTFKDGVSSPGGWKQVLKFQRFYESILIDFRGCTSSATKVAMWLLPFYYIFAWIDTKKFYRVGFYTSKDEEIDNLLYKLQLAQFEIYRLNLKGKSVPYSKLEEYKVKLYQTPLEDKLWQKLRVKYDIPLIYRDLLKGIIKLLIPTEEEAGIQALAITENLEDKLSAREESFFVAGFQSAVRWIMSKDRIK